MKKNIWLLLVAGLSLNMAAFADEEIADADEIDSTENRLVAYVDNGDETASSEEEQTKGNSLLAVEDNQEEEKPENSFC